MLKIENMHVSIDNNDPNGNDDNSNQDNNDDDDDRTENHERRNFLLLDFPSEGADSLSDDLSSDDDDFDEHDFDGELEQERSDDEEHGEFSGDGSENEDDSIFEEHINDSLEDAAGQQQGQVLEGDPSLNGTSISNNQQQSMESNNSVPGNSDVNASNSFSSNNAHSHNHKAIKSLLVRLAQSEENPLIRADIPWSIITSPGFDTEAVGCSSFIVTTPSLIRSLYPAEEMLDTHGTRLLQGMLRMDPPYEAVKMLLEAFPTCCLDMEGFFTACQFAHPNTSRRARGTGHINSKKDKDGNAIFKGLGGVDFDCDSDSDSLEDVGEVVKLVIYHTIHTRRINNIDWGMVAFLGDARISPSHAKLLLRHTPEALVDPQHGAFGVSPLDRMASGVFIHGESNAWVEKLRLALRTAAFVRWWREQMVHLQGETEEEEKREDEEKKPSPVSEATVPPSMVLPNGFFTSKSNFMRRDSSFHLMMCSPNTSTTAVIPQSLPFQSFYPYHELIRLLISPNFKGNKFGGIGFLNTLAACTKSDPNAFLHPDNAGNLPIHIALGSECNTVLGTKGERRLIKYLLDLDKNMALCPEGAGCTNGNERRLPLRMSIENAWPVFDLIIYAALASVDDSNGSGSKTHKSAAVVYQSSSITDGVLSNAGDKERAENRLSEYISCNKVCNRPILHDALSGKYHPRFGIHGARLLVKNIITKVTHAHHPLHQGQNSSSREVDTSHQHSCLTNFVDPNGRTALHVALEHKWPVYDLILRQNPSCLEARDPTRHGFFPFQIAACAYTARYDVKRDVDGTPHESGTNESKNLSSETSDRKIQTNEDRSNGSINSSVRRDNPDVKQEAPVVDDERKAALVEMGMLFELLRENPLCVSWGMSHNDKRPACPDSHCAKSDGKGKVGDLEHMAKGYSLAWASGTDDDDSVLWRKKKKRRRSSILTLLSKKERRLDGDNLE